MKVTCILFMIGMLVLQERVEAQSRGYRSGTGSGASSNRPSPYRGGGYNSGHSTTQTPGHYRNSGNSRPRFGTPDRSTPPHAGYHPGRVPQVPRHNPSPGYNQPSYRPIPPRTGYNQTPNRGPVITRPGSPPDYHPRSPSHQGTPGSRYDRPGTNNRRGHGPGHLNRPIRTHYGSQNYHRPYGHTPLRYTHYYHAPYRNAYAHTARYYRSYDWYNYVFRTNSHYIYAHWIFYPARGYSNGYWTIDNYPYYVYNGYRNRYSTNDHCNYQMVDQYDHTVIQTYWNQFCNEGYDSCSVERDRLNSQMNDYRYFCSETYRDQDFDYSTPSYDEGN